MTPLLGIYGLAIAASCVFGAALAVLGAHLAARDRAMQCLCLGQGAMVGVLSGLALTLTVLQEEESFQGVPFGGAVVVAAASYYASEALAARAEASRSTHFMALFVALLAAGSLVAASVPALEGHLTQRYFGDLATVSQLEAWELLAAGAGLLALLAAQSKALARAGFEQAVLGRPPVRDRGTELWLPLATLLAVAFAVQVTGLLYTLCCLFLPTAVLCRTRRAGLKRHLAACAVVAAAGVGGGFLLSLTLTHLPTVPAVVAVTAALAGVWLAVGG